MNITTPAERDGHDCKLNCPRYTPDTFPAHGDVVQCPHGRWFVAEVSVRPVYGGRMAEWRRAPDVIAANLEAIKHEAETPTRGHGECCDPAPADDGLAEWERELLRPATCCGKCPPIVGGGYDCTCEGNPRCEKTQADPDTVTLRRDDVERLLDCWAGDDPHAPEGPMYRRVRAALGWGDSDDA